MSTVLVVDDSAVDRRLIGGLLEEETQWSVQFASDGIQALAAIERACPDLVVTDLVMPEMDGLELVSEMRSRYPGVPVILITGEGRDDIAVQALRRGAASFVPKRALGHDLINSVRTVLAVSGERRRHARLVECMERSEYVFVLHNDATLFSPLVGFLQDSVTQVGLCDEADRVRVGIALEEALTNAVYHGNLEIDSSLREMDTNAYEAVVAERSQQVPYRDRRVHLQATLTRDEGVFVIRDEGPGFDPGTLPNPTEPANLEKVSGRGVLLMRSFMDQVAYNEVGNEVTLRKRRPVEG